jgi:hypothetical protein
MAARYFRNTTLEVADSDVQDSECVVVRNTQSITIVTNNDKDSHMSAQIQDMLAGVVCTLISVKSQNAKENKELNAKLMAENHKLADRLREKLQHEITKVTYAISQLREETIQTVTN